MADKHRDAHGMCNHFNGWVHNLLCFCPHFPFFFGKSVIHKDINMRDHIKGNLLCEFFRCLFIIHKNTFGLIKQLIHTCLACARGGLISWGNHTLHPIGIMQRLKSDHKLSCWTIWVGNDIATTIFYQTPICGFGIDLWHNQRHIILHAKGGWIINDNTSRLACFISIGFWCLATSWK